MSLIGITKRVTLAQHDALSSGDEKGECSAFRVKRSFVFALRSTA